MFQKGCSDPLTLMRKKIKFKTKQVLLSLLTWQFFLVKVYFNCILDMEISLKHKDVWVRDEKSEDEEEEKYFEKFEPQEQNTGITVGRENR